MSKSKIIKRKKKLGSYPSVTVIFTITLALFVLGLFGSILLHTNKITEHITNNFEVHIYLDDDLSEAQTNQIKNLLWSKNFVNKKNKIEYLSKEEAAKIFIGRTKEDFENVLGYNPLHSSLTVRIKSDYATEDKLELIKNEISSISGVFEVDLVKSLIHQINNNLQKLAFLLGGIALFITIIVFILINNAIKLALFSQRFLIRSMQLVGATSGFIQGPFLKRAIFQGTVGGVLAGLSLFLLTEYAYLKFDDLKLLKDLYSFGILVGILIIAGIIIGFLSSYRAVGKYLRMSLDDLY